MQELKSSTFSQRDIAYDTFLKLFMNKLRSSWLLLYALLAS